MIVENSRKVSKEYGRITRITFDDNSRIYLSDKGITFTLPTNFKNIWTWIKKGFKFEIAATWDEMDIAMKIEEVRNENNYWKNVKI